MPEWDELTVPVILGSSIMLLGGLLIWLLKECYCKDCIKDFKEKRKEKKERKENEQKQKEKDEVELQEIKLIVGRPHPVRETWV